MKKFWVVGALLILSASLAKAQNDSLTFVRSKYKKVKVDKGVMLKQYDFQGDLFASNQFISILEIRPSRKNRFDLAYEPRILRNTSDFGKSAVALAALNGSFFDVKNGGSVDYLRADGKTVAENRLGANGLRAVHQKAGIVISRGKLEVVEWDGTLGWEKELAGEDILLTGPMLIHRQQWSALDTTAFTRMRHPRSAIAVTSDKILLIAVDGRDAKAAGLTLYELQKITGWLKASAAINLDGGGSTTLWVDSKNISGIVNHPCDDNVWDAAGERKVANAILLVKR